MGKKVPPYGLRLGINEYWRSRWYFGKNYRVFLEADFIIRKTINQLFPKSGITEIIIERKSPTNSRVIIKTARPGVLIGRDGQKLKNLQNLIDEKLTKLFQENKLEKPSLEVVVEEVRKPTASAGYLAQLVAIDIEKNKPVRSIMKRIIEKARQNKEVLGVKIKVSGRLGGATIARSETITWGTIPLSRLKAKIDYAQEIAFCKYGIIGIKVWLYKGDSQSFQEER